MTKASQVADLGLPRGRVSMDFPYRLAHLERSLSFSERPYPETPSPTQQWPSVTSRCCPEHGGYQPSHHMLLLFIDSLALGLPREALSTTKTRCCLTSSLWTPSLTAGAEAKPGNSRDNGNDPDCG